MPVQLIVYRNYSKSFLHSLLTKLNINNVYWQGLCDIVTACLHLMQNQKLIMNKKTKFYGMLKQIIVNSFYK